MFMRKAKKLLIILMVLVIGSTIVTPVYAKDKITIGKVIGNYPPSHPNEQFRLIFVVKDPKWTKLKTVADQPTKGTYLKKGDALFYGEKGGNSVGISFGFSLGAGYGSVSGNVSFSIPLGKAYSTSYGKILKASKSGYYIIKAKKNIKPTIILIQSRYKKPFTNEWGPWEKPKVYTKKYEIVQSYSTLVRVKK